MQHRLVMIFGVNIHLKQFDNCAVGEIRLVGESTDREGRVEVWVGGRQWRTVCTGSQELVGAVHKWDTSLKVTQWIDKIMCCEL